MNSNQTDVNGRPVIAMGQVLICNETGKSFVAAKDGLTVNYAWGPNNETFSDEGVDIRQRRLLLDRTKPFPCYLSGNGKHVTGWKGNQLGRVIGIGHGPVGFCRDGVYINVVDVHGNHWYGKGAGRGMCIRLRPVSAKRK